MDEKKYEVLEGNYVLASNMSFDMAIVFIRGYKYTYYKERLNLTIREDLTPVPKVDTGYQE